MSQHIGSSDVVKPSQTIQLKIFLVSSSAAPSVKVAQIERSQTVTVADAVLDSLTAAQKSELTIQDCFLVDPHLTEGKLICDLPSNRESFDLIVPAEERLRDVMRGLRKHERMQRKLLGLLEHDKVHNPADFPREMGVHPADVFKQAFLNLRKVAFRDNQETIEELKTSVLAKLEENSNFFKQQLADTKAELNARIQALEVQNTSLSNGLTVIMDDAKERETKMQDDIETLKKQVATLTREKNLLSRLN